MATMFRAFKASRVLQTGRVKSIPGSSKPEAATVAEKSVSSQKKSSSSSSSSSLRSVKSKPSSSSGILKTFPVSPALGQFLGTSEASRAETVKQIWAYIKERNLQNPLNKKEILCDEKLKKIFEGREKVGFLEMGKLLTPHFKKD